MELISWRPKNNPRSNSSKPNNIGGAIIICKKHPKHQQSPGVCSICLSEKLSLLSKPSRNIIKKKEMIKSRMVSAASNDHDEEEEEEESLCSSSSSYSPSQCSSCASSSACSSPVYDHRLRHHHQLMKSRSMAAAVVTSRRRIIRERISERTDDRHSMKDKDKKSKFWSKLLIRRRGPPRGKKIEETAGLVHSRTMREMLSTAAH